MNVAKKKLDSLKKELAEKNAIGVKLEEEQQLLRQQIDDMENKEHFKVCHIPSLEEKVEVLKGKIEKLIKPPHDEKKHEQADEKYEKQIASLRTEKEKTKMRAAQMEKKFKQAEKQAEKFERNVNVLERQKLELKEEIKTYQEKTDEIRKEMEEMDDFASDEDET